MDWISTEKEHPPIGVWVLVQYTKNYGDAFEALVFQIDSEYGYCASCFESYVCIEDVEKWCLIN